MDYLHSDNATPHLNQLPLTRQGKVIYQAGDLLSHKHGLSSEVQTHPLHTSADKVLVALATTWTRPGSHYYVQLARTGQAHGVITGGDTYGIGHIVSIVTVLLMT